MKISGAALKKLIHDRANEIEVGGATDLERRQAITRLQRALPPPMYGLQLGEEIEPAPAAKATADELWKAEQEHFRISVSEALSGQARWMRTIADLMNPHDIIEVSFDDLIRLNLWPSGKLGEATTFGTRAIL